VRYLANSSLKALVTSLICTRPVSASDPANQRTRRGAREDSPNERGVSSTRVSTHDGRKFAQETRAFEHVNTSVSPLKQKSVGKPEKNNGSMEFMPHEDPEGLWRRVRGVKTDTCWAHFEPLFGEGEEILPLCVHLRLLLARDAVSRLLAAGHETR